MKLSFRAALAAVILSAIFQIGCGDTFRPIAIPIIQNGGQPQISRQAVFVANAGTSTEGDVTHVNVSGDTNMGQVMVGRNPVHAALIGSGSITVVVNKGDESLSVYSTVSPLEAQPPTFVNLNIGSVPVYAYSNVAGAVFVAESGSNTVGVVSLTGAPTALVAEIPVGTTPVALSGSPDGTKIYSANRGSNDVSVIDTGTNALVPATGSLPNPIPVGSAPSFLVDNFDGNQLFVVNSGSNNVSVINFLTNTVTNVAVGASPNYAALDPINRRLWVTNSTGTTVSSINVDVNSASYLSVANISLVVAGCGSPLPKSVTILADGSRAYVADSGCGMVSIINTLSNTVTKTLAVGTAPVSIASAPDSSKVYVANSGSGTLTVIRTTDDTVVTNITAPAGTSPIFVAVTP